MESLFFSFSIVFPLFAVVLLGYFLRQKNFLDDRYVTISNKLCFRVLMPTLIFNNIYANTVSLTDGLSFMGFAALSMVSLIVILMLIVPIIIKDNRKRGVVVQALFRSNFAFFGFPIVASICGDAGLATAALLNAAIIPVFNLTSIVVLETFNSSGGHNINYTDVIKNILKNPFIIAGVLALVFVGAHITLPVFIEKTITDLSKAATPIAMLTIGASFRFKKAAENTKYIITILLGKLVIIPLLMIIVSYMAGFRGPEFVALMVLFASPIAVSSYIMATEANGDGELAGQLVVFSTAASCLTMFFIIFVLRSMGLI